MVYLEIFKLLVQSLMGKGTADKRQEQQTADSWKRHYAWGSGGGQAGAWATEGRDREV